MQGPSSQHILSVPESHHFLSLDLIKSEESSRICSLEFMTLKLSDFTVERELGHGAFGRTYLAHRNSDGMQVCIKSISLFGESSNKKTIQEAETLSRLDHPNIVHFFVSFIFEGVLCIVMEYASQGSLSDIIKVSYSFSPSIVIPEDFSFHRNTEAL